jgi:hypothetical protein
MVRPVSRAEADEARAMTPTFRAQSRPTWAISSQVRPSPK